VTVKGVKFTEEHKRNIGLSGLGKHHVSEEQRKFLSELQKVRQAGKNNSNYGHLKSNIKYKPLHAYIRKYLPRPELCGMCNIKPSRDIHNLDHEYSRNFKTWVWLCHKCHMSFHAKRRW